MAVIAVVVMGIEPTDMGIELVIDSCLATVGNKGFSTTAGFFRDIPETTSGLPLVSVPAMVGLILAIVVAFGIELALKCEDGSTMTVGQTVL